MIIDQHTKEPWEYTHASHGDARGHVVVTEYFVRVPGDNVAIASMVVDPVTGQPSEANARRIVACVNACAGLDTAGLEQLASSNETLASRADRFKRQRDALMVVLEQFATNADRIEWDSYILQGHEHFKPGEAVADAKALLAQIRGDV